MDLPDYDPEDLSISPTQDSLIALLGQELFEHMSESLGGRRLFIPKTAGATSVLSTLLGQEAAVRLSEIYGGMNMDIPLTAGVRAQILRHYRDNVPIVQIPHLVKRSYNFVWSVIRAERRAQESVSQIDLFQ